MSVAVLPPKKAKFDPAEDDIAPQPGPQTEYLSNPADIIFYGGSAGGGKTFGTLLDPLRHIHNPRFGAVIFRRTTPELRAEGGIWDDSTTLYPLLNARSRETTLEWIFPSGAQISMAHMEHEKDRFKWQGSQVCGIYFEEVTHFTRAQFFYMLSRNRSTCGVRPYIRATCNPDPYSWVKDFLAPWLQKDYPFPAKSGEIRWFYRDKGQVVWLAPGQPKPKGKRCKSVTFIRATVHDNQKLLEKDPDYLANLDNLPLIDQLRLRDGDWDTVIEGNYFKREWFKIIDREEVPAKLEREVRFWDFAATEVEPGQQVEIALAGGKKKTPDWTAGVRMGKKDGVLYVLDVIHVQKDPGGVEQLVIETARADDECVEQRGRLVHKRRVAVRWEQEPGSSGKAVTAHYRRKLAGFNCDGVRSTGPKTARALPVSAQAKGGNIKIVRAWWNESWLNEMCAFPPESDEVKDDQVDGTSGAFDYLVSTVAGGMVTSSGEEEETEDENDDDDDPWP